MSAAVGEDYGPVVGGCDCLDGCIQHGVDELGVRARADRPADDLAIEAVDHERQVDLARRDLELNDVGEPFLVGRNLDLTLYRGRFETWFSK